MKQKWIILLTFAFHAVIFSTALDQTNIGIRGTGLGGAFTAVADDSSAVFWNAAGLAFYQGAGEVNLGLYAANVDTKNKALEGSFKDKTFGKSVLNLIPSFFAVFKPTPKLGLGVGFYFPYGGGKVEFDKAYDYDSLPLNVLGEDKTYYLKKDLRAYTFTFSAAYQILDNLSIGAGLSLYYITLSIETEDKLLKFIPPTTIIRGDTSQFISGLGVSGNIGILFKPTKTLSLGLSARLPVAVDLKGDFEIKNSTGNLADGKFKSYKNMKAPLNIGFGIAYYIIDDLRLSLDFEYQGWASSKNIPYKNKPTDSEENHAYGWKNSFRFGLGAEYFLSSDLSLLGGFKLAPSAINDTYLGLDNADLTAYAFFLGAGYQFLSHFKIEGGLSYVYYPDKNQKKVHNDAPVKATGNFSKQILGAGIQIKFLF